MTEETKHKDLPLVTWGPVAAVLVTIGTYLTAQLLAGVLILAYALTQGWSDVETGDWLGQSIVGQFVTVLLVEVFTVLLLWWFLRRRKATLRSLGLVKPKFMDGIYAIAGFGLYFPLVILTSAVAKGLIPGLNLEQEQQIGFQATAAGPELALIFASLVILPPLIEEIVMRGFLYTGLKSKLPIWAAVVITSALFGVAHLQFGNGAPLLWVAFIDTFVLSVVLIGVRELGKSLWPAIFLHALKNGLAFAALFIFKLV